MAKKRNLKRQLYIFSKIDEGYAIIPPKHKALVLSGGGSKGAAYIGMMKAMEEKGVIKDLTHISGASAGSITASVIAMGMSYEHAEQLVLQLDITKLLDTKGFRLRAKGERFRNVFEVIYLYQLKEHLKYREKPINEANRLDYETLQHKIALYETALSKQGISITSIDDIFQLVQSSKLLKKLDDAFVSIPKMIKNKNGEKIENPRITFTDMSRLRSLLPINRQHLIKNLSVVTTNQTKKTLEIYNEQYGADESIAEKVQHSSAHPLIFSPALNEEGEFIADGGILDNMPTIALKKTGINNEEILCVKIESDDSFKDRVNAAASHVPEAITAFAQWADDRLEEILGGRLFTGRTHTRNREKIFHNLGNMLYLNTGSITTTSIYPTKEEKVAVIEMAYQSTRELLNNHSRVFDNPLIAMVYLGEDKLKHTLLSEGIQNELFKCAAQAQKIFLLQNQLSQEIKSDVFDDVENYLTQIEDVLQHDSGLNTTQQEQIMSLCLKQINFYTEGKLENHIIEQINAERNARKVSWFTQLLRLLWQPIEWVFSLFSTKEPEHVVEEKPEVMSEEKTNTITPMKLIGLFAIPIHSTPLVKDEFNQNENPVLSG